MSAFKIINTVKRFPGQYGWFYVELDKTLSKDLRPLMKDSWPALIKAEFKINNTVWRSSIMPIKDGPLFIALPARVRKTEKIADGERVTVTVNLISP